MILLSIGQHRIDITFANVPVQGSPFFTEVYDPTQVRIGPLPKDIISGIENTFEINLDNAGNLPIDIKITSPTGITGKEEMNICVSLLEEYFIVISDIS